MADYRSRNEVPICLHCVGTGEVKFSWFPAAQCDKCLGTGKNLDELRLWYKQKRHV